MAEGPGRRGDPNGLSEANGRIAAAWVGLWGVDVCTPDTPSPSPAARSEKGRETEG